MAVFTLLSTLAQSPASAAPKKAKLPAFKQQWLRPYLTDGRGAEARRALLARRPKRAIKALRRHLGRKKVADGAQARYLLAHALLQAGRFSQAAALFEKLGREYPLLRDYHRFHQARCRYRMKQFARAEALAAAVTSDSPLKRDADLLRADALRAQGHHKKVVEIWSLFLQRFPRGRRVGQAHFRIAQSLERLAAEGPRGRDERERLLVRALDHYKQVTIKAPLWRREAEANRRLAALAARLKEGKELARLSSWQRFTRARVFYTKMRHGKTERALTALLKKKTLSPKLRCKATYHLAMTVFRRRQRARAAPIFAKAAKWCRGAKERELTLKSLYNGAKGLMRAHKFDEAIAQFESVEREFSRHSWADDARLWAAEAAEAKGDRAATERLLSTIPDRYPKGDMAREALWRLARAALIQRQYGKAIKYLDRILSEMGRARYYYAEGQAHYWKARILDLKKRSKQARRHYERCIREYPLSYYALAAFNRLRERHKPLFRKLRRELITAAGKNAHPWAFKPRKLYREPGFRRGVELARLGFGAAAAAELAAVGVGIRRGAPTKDLWLAAVLFDRAGLWNLSHRVPRVFDHEHKENYPLGPQHRRWRIAYPMAFGPLVSANARKAEISPAAIWAVMREESGFAPTIESWANAVGLMQLLIRTARKAGNEHRIDVTRRRLHDPAVNIKLGATYLGFLHRTFGNNPALAIAGYNAGEGAVMGWLKKRRRIPLDEFLDRIPYDQTRRYTKRVLSSLFAYSVLYGNGPARIPRLTQKLPKPRRLAFGRSKKKSKKSKKGKKRAAR